MQHPIRFRRARLAAALLLVSLELGTSAKAATFLVGHIGESGPGSFRQAVLDANLTPGPDFILMSGAFGTITLTSGPLEITDSVQINGLGSLTLSGGKASRIFIIHNDASLIRVELIELELTEAYADHGAAILNLGEDLILRDVSLVNNIATGAGGALWGSGSEAGLTIQSSFLADNRAGGDGGAIYLGDAGGPVVLFDTQIAGNQASGQGGGMYIGHSVRDVMIERSLFAGNTAVGAGGGLYWKEAEGGTLVFDSTTLMDNRAAAGGGAFLDRLAAHLLIVSGTISGNAATAGDGGGLAVHGLDGSLDLRHCTLTRNSATGAGGGLFAEYGSPSLDHTILGDNSATSNHDLANGAGAAFGLRFSLVESPGSALFQDGGGNILNQDPQVSPDRTGVDRALTHALAPTSPARNAGDPAFTPPPTFDQRGDCFPRVGGGRIDIGAFEYLEGGTIQFSQKFYTVSENAGAITIPVTRAGGREGKFLVLCSTNSGTAQEGTDYERFPGGASWPDGSAETKIMTIDLIDDSIIEPPETFVLTLFAPIGSGMLGEPSTAVVTIVDDDFQAAAQIPTLGEAGRFLLASLLGLLGLSALRRKSRRSTR